MDPPFVSTDPDVFQQELASVSVQGGGDCPEMTLSGKIQNLFYLFVICVIFSFFCTIIFLVVFLVKVE